MDEKKRGGEDGEEGEEERKERIRGREGNERAIQRFFPPPSQALPSLRFLHTPPSLLFMAAISHHYGPGSGGPGG